MIAVLSCKMLKFMNVVKCSSHDVNSSKSLCFINIFQIVTDDFVHSYPVVVYVEVGINL